jgi:hypothetical protein
VQSRLREAFERRFAHACSGAQDKRLFIPKNFRRC